jgi:hypothetical protein
METFLYVDNGQAGSTPGAPTLLDIAKTGSTERKYLVVQANTPQEADALVRDALTTINSSGTVWNGLGGDTGFAHLPLTSVTIKRDALYLPRPGVTTYFLNEVGIGTLIPNDRYVKYLFISVGTNLVVGWYKILAAKDGNNLYIDGVPYTTPNSFSENTDWEVKIPGGRPYVRLNWSDTYDVVSGRGNQLHDFVYGRNAGAKVGKQSFPHNVPGIIFASTISILA